MLRKYSSEFLRQPYQSHGTRAVENRLEISFQKPSQELLLRFYEWRAHVQFRPQGHL